MQSPSEILGDKGPFAEHVAGFAPRSVQQEMAEAVAETLAQGEILIAEAGTGTGKTFAYLVAALLSGLKVIISTGTKNLQDQLFHRDLPVVREALQVSVTVSLLKGRANYLCLHRLSLTEAEGRLRSRDAVDKLIRIRAWSGQTRSGDIAEMYQIPEDDPVWQRATSTRDNCLGQDCGDFKDCFLVKARRCAQAADVVVVNHHLLFADMALREDGFGELLPTADAFIIDEAHQVPETAANFFGISLSGNQIIELARDTTNEFIAEVNEGNELLECADKLKKTIADYRLALGTEVQRAQFKKDKKADAAADDVITNLAALSELLRPLAERSKGLEGCYRRSRDLQEKFTTLTKKPPEDYIHWFETHRRSFTLHLTPMDVADNFQQHLYAMANTWIFTSATLAVGDSFDHFSRRLGLQDVVTKRWDSPFDYQNQSLLFVPQGLPEPNAPSFTSSVVEMALQVLEASQGRAFVLFTSYRALNEAAERLHDVIDYPLLVQGDAPRDTLLERFRDYGNAVLLGTSSFWEGVDVRGEALSCVIIDKLPFASPGDPVLQARINALRAQGGNPFMQYQLPSAVIALKQGAGRLIRDVTDRGVLVICDPRLYNKPYGQVFLKSLPAMPRTRSLSDVQQFFAEEECCVV